VVMEWDGPARMKADQGRRRPGLSAAEQVVDFHTGLEGPPRDLLRPSRKIE